MTRTMEVLRGRGATGRLGVLKRRCPKGRVGSNPTGRTTSLAVRSHAEFDNVVRLLQGGLNHCEISRRSGIPRGTVRDWAHRESAPGAWRSNGSTGCPHCEPDTAPSVPASDYVYLLGLYLGDGCISRDAKGVFKLRVALDNRYPGIIRECIEAMASVSERRVGLVRNVGCTEVHASWKHWP